MQGPGEGSEAFVAPQRPQCGGRAEAEGSYIGGMVTVQEPISCIVQRVNKIQHGGNGSP